MEQGNSDGSKRVLRGTERSRGGGIEGERKGEARKQEGVER